MSAIMIVLTARVPDCVPSFVLHGPEKQSNGVHRMSANLKYRFYQRAVQAPPADVEMLETVFRDAYDQEPQLLREDFCGTFLLACEWVKQGGARSALALDIDPEPLRYGQRLNLSRLAAPLQRRVRPIMADVRRVTRPPADMICAMNFSYYVFKEPDALLTYFRACRRSLKRHGVLAMDIVGGRGFCCAPHREQRSYRHERGRLANQPWFTYVWRHRRFNSRRREGLYEIDFKKAGGAYYEGVFRYDWRVWSLDEVREALGRAGFRRVEVYQQTDDGARYEKIRKDPRDHCWICYVAGIN